MFFFIATKTAIVNQKAPLPNTVILSDAIRFGDTLYVSGQVPFDPKSRQLIRGTFEEEAHQVFGNILAILEAAGGSMDDIIKYHVYLPNLEDFPKLNEVAGKYFKKPYPARTTVGVQLLDNIKIEVDAIAQLDVDHSKPS